MAFSDFLALAFGRRPVWLYRISIGAVDYHFTSRGSDYTTPANRPSTDYPSGQLWTSAPIIRGEIYQAAAANRSDTWIRMPTLNAAMQAIILNADSSDMSVAIWQGFLGDPDNEFVLQFTGRIVSVERDLLLTTVVCDTALSEAESSSVAQVVQRPCRHAHYFTNADGGGCRLTLADFQTSAPCTAVVGNTLTVPLAALQPDGTYLAGILEYDSVEYMIIGHTGSTLVVESEALGLAAAVALGTTNVLIAPGCQLTPDNCNDFGNILNFGGFPDMLETAFDGRSIA